MHLFIPLFQKGIKVKKKSRKNVRTHIDTLKLNDILLNDECSIKEIKKEIKNFLQISENKDVTYEPTGHCKSSVKREAYSNKYLH